MRTDYQKKHTDDIIHKFAVSLGLNEELLRQMFISKSESSDINAFGQFDKLMQSIDKAKAKEYFESTEGPMPMHRVMIKADRLVRDFILDGGFEVTETKQAQHFAYHEPDVNYGVMKVAEKGE